MQEVSKTGTDDLGFGCTGSVDVIIVRAWMLFVVECVLDALVLWRGCCHGSGMAPPVDALVA